MGVLDLNFIFLQCPFNLLGTVCLNEAPIEVKQNSCWATVRVLISVSDTGGFVNLVYMDIYTSHALFLNHPSSGVNFAPEAHTTFVMALYNK